MFDRDRSAFRLQVGTEKIAVEIVGQLDKELVVEVGLNLLAGLFPQNFPQVSRSFDADLFQVRSVADAAVEQVTGEDESAKKGIERLRLKPCRLEFAKLLPCSLEFAKQIAINPLARIEVTPMAME